MGYKPVLAGEKGPAGLPTFSVSLVRPYFDIIKETRPLQVSARVRTNCQVDVIQGSGKVVSAKGMVVISTTEASPTALRGAVVTVGQRSSFPPTWLSDKERLDTHTTLRINSNATMDFHIGRSVSFVASQKTSRFIELGEAGQVPLFTSFYIESTAEYDFNTFSNEIPPVKARQKTKVQFVPTTPDFTPVRATFSVVSTTWSQYIIQSATRLVLSANQKQLFVPNLKIAGAVTPVAPLWIESTVISVSLIQKFSELMSDQTNLVEISLSSKTGSQVAVDIPFHVVSIAEHDGHAENAFAFQGGNVSSFTCSIDEGAPTAVGTSFHITSMVSRDVILSDGILMPCGQESSSLAEIRLDDNNVRVQTSFFLASDVDVVPIIGHAVEVGVGQYNSFPPPDLFDEVPFARCINAPCHFKVAPEFHVGFMTDFLAPIFNTKGLIYIDDPSVALSGVVFVRVSQIDSDTFKEVNIRIRFGSSYSDFCGYFQPGVDGKYSDPMFFSGGESGWIEIEIEARSENLAVINDIYISGLSISAPASDPFVSTLHMGVVSETEYDMVIQYSTEVLARQKTRAQIITGSTGFLEVKAHQLNSALLPLNQPRIISSLIWDARVYYVVGEEYINPVINQRSSVQADLFLRIVGIEMPVKQDSGSTVDVSAIARCEFVSTHQINTAPISLGAIIGQTKPIGASAKQLNSFSITVDTDEPLGILAEQFSSAVVDFGSIVPMVPVSNQKTGFSCILYSSIISGSGQETGSFIDIAIGKDQIDVATSQVNSSAQALSADDASLDSSLTQSILTLFNTRIKLAMVLESGQETSCAAVSLSLFGTMENVSNNVTASNVTMNISDLVACDANHLSSSDISMGNDEPILLVSSQNTSAEGSIDEYWGLLANQLSSILIDLHLAVDALSLECGQYTRVISLLGSTEPVEINSANLTKSDSSLYPAESLISKQKTRADLFIKTTCFCAVETSQNSGINISMEGKIYVSMHSSPRQRNAAYVNVVVVAYIDPSIDQKTGSSIGLYRQGDVTLSSAANQLTGFNASLVKTTIGPVDKPDVIDYDACEI